MFYTLTTRHAVAKLNEDRGLDLSQRKFRSNLRSLILSPIAGYSMGQPKFRYKGGQRSKALRGKDAWEKAR